MFTREYSRFFQRCLNCAASVKQNTADDVAFCFDYIDRRTVPGCRSSAEWRWRGWWRRHANDIRFQLQAQRMLLLSQRLVELDTTEALSWGCLTN